MRGGPKCRPLCSINTLIPPERMQFQQGLNPRSMFTPVVVDAMRELGIDLSAAKPQKLTAELAQGADMLITMGCGDECPYVPGLRRDDWPLPDPKGQGIEVVRQTRDEIMERVVALLKRENLLPA